MGKRKSWIVALLLVVLLIGILIGYQIKDSRGNEKNYAITETVPQSSVDSTPTKQGRTVYITASGKKYHKAGCSYLKQSKIAITLQQAKEQGYTPCSRCW